MSQKSDNFYHLLGVPKNASTDDIKSAYRRLIRHYHPDTGVRDDDKVRLINTAYETLKDPIKRANYDQSQAWLGTKLKFTKSFEQVFDHFKDNFKDNVHFVKNSVKHTFEEVKAHKKDSQPPKDSQPLFNDKAFDDKVTVLVYPWQALFGDKIVIHTDYHHLQIPMPSFEHQLTLKITGAGKPTNDKDTPFGDLYVTFDITNPKLDNLSDAQKQAWLALKSTMTHP